MKPLVHVSGMFGAARGNTSWIVPLAWHPDNKNALITIDLAGDIRPLLEETADTLRERLYSSREQRGSLPAVPLKLVHINKCPVLAPASTLRPEDAERLAIDRQHCLENLALLRRHSEIREKVVSVFATSREFPANSDVDAQLYNGFFGEADKHAMNIIRTTEPRNLPALDLTYHDPRINILLFRYRARNFPGTLDDSEQQRWLEHRREMLSAPRVEQYIEELQQLAALYPEDERRQSLLKSLYRYAETLLS